MQYVKYDKTKEQHNKYNALYSRKYVSLLIIETLMGTLFVCV